MCISKPEVNGFLRPSSEPCAMAAGRHRTGAAFDLDSAREHADAALQLMMLDRGGVAEVAPEAIARTVAERLGLPLLAEGWGAGRTQLRWTAPACAAA
jgi:hypothetical protein